MARLGALQRRAQQAAMRSSLRVRVGAASSNGLIGWNQKKTHPALRKWGFHEGADLHAEIALLIQNCPHEDHDVVVCRLLRCGKQALARPCTVCMAALIESGVRTVTWSTEDGWESLHLN